jgi:hypothetical protein
MTTRSLLPHITPIREVDRHSESREPAGSVVVTGDAELIQKWAREHDAEPATGEATRSGPATARHVQDGDAGIRFNYPGAAPFRPISWDEWFDNFRQYELMFVYELHKADGTTSGSYRLVPRSTLRERVDVELAE